MPDCPNGVRLKAEWAALESLWAWADEEVCERIEPILQLFRLECSVLVPRLIDPVGMCAALPRPIPELDFVELATRGAPLVSYGPFIDWVTAWWENEHWSAYCECVPGLGSGTCPEVGAGPITVSRSNSMGTVTCSTISAPHGWTQSRMRVTINNTTMPGSAQIRHRFRDAATALEGTDFAGRTSNHPANATSYTSWVSIGTGGSSNDVRSLEVQAQPATGGGNVNSTVYTFDVTYVEEFSGTCADIETPYPPPDPLPDPELPDVPPMPPLPASCTIDTLCSLIHQLVPIVTNTNQLLNLLQRFTTPFDTEPGTVHVGLTGSGSFEVSGLVGVQVVITSPLPSRQLEGAPPYIWDLGWMSVMSDDGMIIEQRITREVQVWTPRSMPQATTWGYYFKEGVTATVTELGPTAY